MAAQEVVEGGPEFAGAVVGDALGAVLQRADVQMVLQVAADARQRMADGDALFLQMLRRSDAGLEVNSSVFWPAWPLAMPRDDLKLLRRLLVKSLSRGYPSGWGAFRRSCRTA